MRCDREQTAHLQTALLRDGAARAQIRTAQLGSIRSRVWRDCHLIGLAEFTNCWFDLSIHLREHVLGGRIRVLVFVRLIGGGLALRLLPVRAQVQAPAFAWPPVWR